MSRGRTPAARIPAWGTDADADTDTSTEDSDTGPAGFAPCPTDGSDCNVMPVGDSITFGTGSSSGGGYRFPLFQKTHAAGKKLIFVGRAADGPDTVDTVPFLRNHEGYSSISVDEFIAQQAQARSLLHRGFQSFKGLRGCLSPTVFPCTG